MENQTNLPTEENNVKTKNLNSKRIQKQLSKAVRNNAAKKTAISALLPFVTYLIVGLIALIIIIGIVVFFITMPGMVMEKLKKLSLKIGKDLAAFFGGDTTKQVDDQEIYDTLDYIENMGYDLKGYGFLTDYVGGSDDGVERDDEDNITNAKSDFIYTYLVSDNYIYTIANFNQTNGLSNSNGIPTRILGGFLSVFQRSLNILTNGQLGRFWGKGMLSIYYESSIGVPGMYYGGAEEALGWSDISIDLSDSEDKKLDIRRGIGSSTVSYNLNGWTGRYGMPLDFLIATHIATMMPDLAYDMVESFDTQIVILLHPEGSILEGNATYNPYIAYVKNHWYRDVYFVQAEKEFVDYDYEYESVMNERWTLYKTNDDGEYLLYVIDEKGDYVKNLSSINTEGVESNKLKQDSSGYYYYDGSKEDAAKSKLKVAKKAETLKYSDDSQFEDISWNKNSNGRWSAYKEKNGSLTQTGEGLRTETNSEIKKIFLQNRYFRYDGSKETAEIITNLRKRLTTKLGRSDNDLYYGVVKGINSDGNDVDYTDVTYSEDGKTYKIEDYSGEVSLNQDSLTAFSMLENEHTLDADYIYRDFKELVVELGYFEKEELTDETPRLLEFLVPEIGSFGYPTRSIDKEEHEYGTMLHSKMDIDADLAIVLAENDDLNQTAHQHPDLSAGVNGIMQNVGNINNSLVQDGNMMNLRDTVGGTRTDVDPSSVSIQDFMAAADEIHAHVEQNGFTYGDGGAGICDTLEAADGTKKIDCSAYVSYVLTAVGLMEGREYTGSKAAGDGMYGLWSEYLLTREEAGELQEGDILLSDSHTQINGEDYMQYNCGSTSAIQSRPTQYFPDFYTDVIRLPFGNRPAEGEVYEGYAGNEAVVSPVTGILLEYGTYNGEKENENGEEYRVNTDLKYPPQSLANNEEELPESIIQSDKVGYAKILVLDDENYKKLESALKGSTRWRGTDSLLKPNGNYTDIKDLNEDEIENWSDADKTLYGYKEFAESYKKYGIDGYVVYIDGFKCELPDEDFDNEDKDILKSQCPNGENLRLSDFESVTTGIFSNGGNISNEDDLLLSEYEPEEEYKLASKTTTDKLNAENQIKEEAISAIYAGGIRFIKEGTIIGRTITDYELVTKIRNKESMLREYRAHTFFDSDDETDKVLGNYLRILLRDNDKTVVENAEDYMKLDDGIIKNDKLEMEKFLFWMGCALENGHLSGSKGSYISKADDLGDGAGPTHFYGLTHYNNELAKKVLGHELSPWGADQTMQDLTDIYLALIAEKTEYIKQELGEDISDNYLQAFLSIEHNYGNLTNRGDEYKANGSVSEITWTTYNGRFAEALRKRRKAEWKLITDGMYVSPDNLEEEIPWHYSCNENGVHIDEDVSEETPFSDFCTEILGIEVHNDYTPD